MEMGWTPATTTTSQAGSTFWTAWSVAEAGSSPGTDGTGPRQGTGVRDLGPDAFFRLLAAQLRYQDPLRPMEDTAFIAQVAQLTQLEEIRAMHRELAGVAGLALLGREVEITTTEGDIKGPVTGVYLDPKEPALTVGDTRVAWKDIIALRLLEAASMPETV